MDYKEKIIFMIKKMENRDFLKKIYTCVNFFYKRERGEH